MPTPLPSPARLKALIEPLEAGLLERGGAVRLALLAALAGEHVLLIGPPGTAKSELARRLHRAFADAGYFERLLTRFSTPEELFGPLSLKALEDDRYERLTDGYLPTASIAFLDEVFKANSAILNALLTLLNEREFDNGSGRARTPLLSVVGATNEAPADESLLAFRDRFLLRVPVEPVGDDAFAALLRLPAQADAGEPAGAPGLTRDELAAIAEARAAVALPDEVLALLADLRGWARAQQPPLVVSDRRWRRLVGLLQVQALTEGRAAIDRLDLWLLPYAVAADAATLAPVQRWLAERLELLPDDAAWLARAVQAFEQQLSVERSRPGDDGGDDSAGKLALARAIGGREAAGADAAGLRIVGDALEQHGARRFSPVHVAARVGQLDALIARIDERRAPVAARADALRAALAERLWLPPALARQWLGNVEATLATVDALRARLAAARDVFAALPVDEALAGDAPDPVALRA